MTEICKEAQDCMDKWKNYDEKVIKKACHDICCKCSEYKELVKKSKTIIS
jgi:aerobic-type carbon monoxide dehydrogenase small subunit (CoxS/CutS family)